MAKYRIKDLDNTDDFKELARISHNLRFYTKVWKEHFGSQNRENMRTWEQKMDEWLFQHISYKDMSEFEAENGSKKYSWVTMVGKDVK